jgi:hypothetical protein
MPGEHHQHRRDDERVRDAEALDDGAELVGVEFGLDDHGAALREGEVHQFGGTWWLALQAL